MKVRSLIIIIFLCTTVQVAHAQSTENTKKVYLTFDADMTPSMEKKLESGKVSSWYSKDLVSYLEKEKIPATIFVTGMFARVYPDLVEEMATYSQIEIANHTYDHAAFEGPCYGLSVLKTDAEKNLEMQETQDILTALVGYTPAYFRHPGLCHNKHDVSLAQKMGLTVSDEGLVSGDAFATNAKRVVRTVLHGVRDGSVVIMHLGGPNAPATSDAVKSLVPKLKEMQYTFATLSP